MNRRRRLQMELDNGRELPLTPVAMYQTSLPLRLQVARGLIWGGPANSDPLRKPNAIIREQVTTTTLRFHVKRRMSFPMNTLRKPSLPTRLTNSQTIRMSGSRITGAGGFGIMTTVGITATELTEVDGKRQNGTSPRLKIPFPQANLNTSSLQTPPLRPRCVGLRSSFQRMTKTRWKSTRARRSRSSPNGRGN